MSLSMKYFNITVCRHSSEVEKQWTLALRTRLTDIVTGGSGHVDWYMDTFHDLGFSCIFCRRLQGRVVQASYRENVDRFLGVMTGK